MKSENEQDSFDDNHWVELEKHFEEKGKLDGKLFASFFRDVLMSHGEYVQENEVFKKFEQVLRADQTFFEEYFDFWLEAFDAYKVNHLSNRHSSNQRSESNVFWLTNACGQPYPRPSHWPHRSGTGYESVSDGKTSVGMDRTDDIKKGIYQVLKIATESKPNESEFKVKTALISNIHAVRHYDEYLSSLEDVMWLVDKRTDKSKEVRKIGDLPDEFAVYNLFDGIISFTESHMRDDWIKSKFSF